MSKGYMNYVASMSIFSIFVALIMITGGLQANIGEEAMEEYNITEEDLRISPDIPDPTISSIDLEEDVVESDNIRFDSIEDLEDPDYDTDVVVSAADAEEEAWVMYRIPDDTEEFVTRVTRWGFFTSSGLTMEGYVTPDTDQEPTNEEGLKDEQAWLPEETNYVRFVFEEDREEARLYDLEVRDSPELSLIQSASAWVSSAATAMMAYFQLVTGLPAILFWISLVFGIIATVILLEIVLW